MDDDWREEMEEKVAGEEESVDIGQEKKILGSNTMLVGLNSLPGKSHDGHLI